MGNHFSRQKTSNENSVFAAFPSLPAEIQLENLRLAVPGPRVITIVERPADNHTFHAPSIGMLGGFYLSRVEILKQWKLCFASWTRHPVYFNPNLDILYFDTLDGATAFLISNANNEERSLVQSIAIKANPEYAWTSRYLETCTDALGRMLNDLPNLKHVILLATNSSKLSEFEIVSLEHRLEHVDRVAGIERRLPVFSVLTYKPTPRGIEAIKMELVARRVATNRVHT